MHYRSGVRFQSVSARYHVLRRLALAYCNACFAMAAFRQGTGTGDGAFCLFELCCCFAYRVSSSRFLRFPIWKTPHLECEPFARSRLHPRSKNSRFVATAGACVSAIASTFCFALI
ncbi:hypothetical protein TRVL_09964 [Trypanosoma vivax]|nr:hypothetical protein TRVL_09964 [Trypanosoma vivax]